MDIQYTVHVFQIFRCIKIQFRKIESFFNCEYFDQVFAPVLLKDDKWSRNFDPKLQNLLSELEAGLGSVIRKQDPSARRSEGSDDSLGGK